ncbi:hypothetical protein L202_02637 [Cryptococcus amylolentus CBS 6039]|uniref:Uncharacterized protein n=2 Tax=Cryptococcus amylolentus TaxID=104669 RepID=A0A1E3HW51_9TREE|nr:hypothetical protein L202_02637 [Cryptococcus amylolentus CBS 6039]ODN80385.1 hypothetical protein L202_02637 [Cryptococcus amylolentus CBS 6039]ODO09017.1 hypothetical protein I350_02614 [Cryptococcus amylolentus CBS 6273]
MTDIQLFARHKSSGLKYAFGALPYSSGSPYISANLALLEPVYEEILKFLAELRPGLVLGLSKHLYERMKPWAYRDITVTPYLLALFNWLTLQDVHTSYTRGNVLNFLNKFTRIVRIRDNHVLWGLYALGQVWHLPSPMTGMFPKAQTLAYSSGLASALHIWKYNDFATHLSRRKDVWVMKVTLDELLQGIKLSQMAAGGCHQVVDPFNVRGSAEASYERRLDIPSSTIVWPSS